VLLWQWLFSDIEPHHYGIEWGFRARSAYAETHVDELPPHEKLLRVHMGVLVPFTADAGFARRDRETPQDTLRAIVLEAAIDPSFQNVSTFGEQR
jgi:hypothetical protein